MTVTSVAVPDSMHVGDLDGSATVKELDGEGHDAHRQCDPQGGGERHRDRHVERRQWHGGCRTSVVGICTVSKASISTTVGSMTFTITGVTLSGRVYDGAAGRDPDPDGSTGTSPSASRSGLPRSCSARAAGR